MIKFFAGDALPVFQFTVKDEDDVIVDLTNCTLANCYIRKEGATTNLWTDVADILAAIQTPATAGRINYTLPTGGIIAPGSYTAQLALTFGAPSPVGIQSTERFRFQVEARLKP